MIFEYKGVKYPDYLKTGNAMQFILPAAQHFCRGEGLDVGGGKWPLPGANVVDLQAGGDALKLPEGKFPYVFSSHCLEHISDPVAAIEHWMTRLSPGSPLVLYLPHADGCKYWRPENCRRHLHRFRPQDVTDMLSALGFVNIIATEGWDAYYSFMVVGFMPEEKRPAAPDEPFRWLIEDSSAHIHGDEQFRSLFERFGADVFRRSSAVETEFVSIIENSNFRGRRCVEIGSYNGMTALVLSRYFDEVVSFDIFPHTIKHTVLDFCGVKNVRFIDIRENAEKWKILADLDFDAAYVDGDHANDTETDFGAVEKCGRVLFHEYWQKQMPVWNLVNRLRLTGDVKTEGKFALWTKHG